MSDNAGSSHDTQQEWSQQRRCISCFSLPPSHFLLGLQSFSIHDGNPAGIARRLLTEHQRAVQRLQRKCTGQTKTEQRQQRESSSKQLIPRQSGDLQPHARGEPSLQWHDQQRPQQALWREFQEEVTERAEATVLPATLLPTSLSLIAAPSNAEDDTEIALRAGRQQRPWPKQPFKELEDTEARVVEEAQLVACEGQADAAPALRKKTGYAGVEQLQQPPVRQHLLGGDRKDAVGALAVHAPAGEAGQRREDNCVGESARHQVAGRFQVIKRLRHPHLCAYTHMLRRGRRIYVVSEYWSLSLADLLNQQLESRLRKNRRQDAASIASSPCRCSSCVVSFKGSNVGAGHSGDAESRSNSTSITESAAKERCADGGNRCSATKNSVFCFGETLLPLMPETFLRRVMRQTLSALEYLNSCGIVHGRLSLSAIRFNAEGDVRVADWGLHYLTAHGRCSPHTQIHPPLPFISPEILMIGPHVSAIPPTSAPPVMPTASTAAFAASCYNASAPLTEIRRGVTSDRPAVASGFRLAVPSARETVTDPMTPDFGMQTAPHCWLHSTTADVFSIGIILLHVLQGPPRTPLPDKLVDTLRRLTVQQQQSEEVRFTCNRQTLREAQTDKKQEHGQVISGCVTDENPEARGRPEGQHKRLIALRGFLKQKQRQHLALKQRAKQQQAKSHVTVAHQQQACTETDRHTPSVKKNHELSFHAEGRPVEEEISTQPVEASPTERSLAEGTKEDGSRVPQSGAGALYWDEWNGCERTKMTEKFKGPPCSSSSVYRSESELIADEMLLQGPASCLHYLRHVERIALMLLYVHCGYEGVQKSVSFPALAGQEATRTCTGDKLGFRYREGIDAADNMLPSQALATRPQRCETPRWADACAASASICQKRSAIGSCIGEGVKHFWRQQKHHLLESLRCLLRGPCSITLQTGTYETLLKVMHPHIQAQKLQRCNWKHTVQQPHMQEVPVLATKQYFVGADKGEEAGWLAPQQDVQPVTWQQMAAAGLAPTEHETISVTLPDSCALLSEAEDVFLEFVVSAAVDWLSGTNIWPAHVRNLCDNDGASGASYFLKGYFPSGSTGVQSTASSSEKGKPCVERVETAAALESTLTAKTTGMVSQELCDFLCLCLSLSPNDRPTPAEALNSAWLQSQETATPHAPFDPYEEQQPHRRKVPVQHRKNSVLSTTNINAGDGNMPLHSRVTTLLGKETEAALWCPQSAGAAVALLQQLYLEESLQTAVAAGLPTRGHQIDDLAEAVLPVNMQTLLQRNYGVPVEEVFYWWQLLGHDVHSTLTSRNAFRPVSSCLRIPLASVRTTELVARTSPGAALYRSASPVESAHAVYRADATKAHETSLAAARKRACLQQRRRELRDVAPTGGPSWTYKTDADGIIAGKAADGSSGRERLSTNWQRRRIPFLLPFADMWGQLHGPAGDDRNASRKMGISNSSVSGTRSSGVFKGRSSKGSKEESWNTRPVKTGACGCARNEGWVRLPSPTGGRERSAPAANLFEQVYKPCMGSSKVRDSASPEKFRTVTSICSSGLHQFGGAECFSKRTDIFEKDQSSTYSTGNCSALSADSFASEYSTTDELTANQDEMARSASKYTERGVRGSGKAYDGSLATADVAEASSFFACGLQNAGRKWTSIGFIWKEGDARIRGVGLADVLLALDAADQLPLSKAEEVIFWCHMFALPADPCALYIHAAASLSLSAPTEAAIDIPPSLRSEIWAALLHVDYAAEAAAGPFLFEQLVREASALPASKQLKSVRFFGCHEVQQFMLVGTACVTGPYVIRSPAGRDDASSKFTAAAKTLLCFRMPPSCVYLLPRCTKRLSCSALPALLIFVPAGHRLISNVLPTLTIVLLHVVLCALIGSLATTILVPAFARSCFCTWSRRARRSWDCRFSYIGKRMQSTEYFIKSVQVFDPKKDVWIATLQFYKSPPALRVFFVLAIHVASLLLEHVRLLVCAGVYSESSQLLESCLMILFFLQYHDVLGSAYGATQLRRLLQALLVQGFSPPHPYCTLVTPPAQSDCSTSRQSEVSFRPVFCCVSESKDNASQKYESLNAPPTQLSRSTTSLSRDVSFLRKETADPRLFEAKGHPQVFDEKREFSIDGISIRTKAGLAAAEQVSITVQGLDALAAPFLLLYETCPQLALCCLQRFLLRDWQHQLLLITTPCSGLDVACETGGRKNQNYVLDEPVQTRKQTIAESVVGGEINATGQRNLALGLPGWGSAAALALEKQLQCFRQLLAFVDPVVAAHLSRCIGLKPEVYVVPWLMTSFSHALELHQLYLLWDAVLLRPAGFVLCVAVCLVHFLRVPLLKLARDDEVAALSLLQNAAGFVHIPALSAAAAALQDALPPSILLSPLASNEPAEILRPPTSSSGGANAGAQSLTPSPRSIASSQTTRVLPAAAAQQSAHERQTRQVWEQPEQRYRKILAESGVTEAPQPRRLSATGAAKRNAGYSSPTLPLRRSESNGKASYNGRKSVTSAERGASPTKCFEKCPCRMQMSLGQSFCISGPAIRQDGDKAKYGEGRVQLVDDASGSDPEPHGSRSASGRVGNRETLRSNKHSNMPSGAGAVHLLQQKRGGKLAEGSQCKLNGEGGGSNERFQPPMWRGRSRCKSERPLSIQEPGSKDDGGESHLQRAHGDTTYTAHEMKHGVHARARAVVAAVIKGPALMLVGSPRKIRRRNAFFQKRWSTDRDQESQRSTM